MLPLDGDPSPFLDTSFNETMPMFSPDGQRFLMIKEAGPEATQINVVLNWFEELKRLVPTP